MSILQEYEKIRIELGEKLWGAIEIYLNEKNKGKKVPKVNDFLENQVDNPNKYLFLSDVLYNEKEYHKFDEWYKANQLNMMVKSPTNNRDGR